MQSFRSVSWGEWVKLSLLSVRLSVPPLKFYFIYRVLWQLMMAELKMWVIRCHTVGEVGRLEVLMLFWLHCIFLS